MDQIKIFSLNDKFHFFCYLGLSFLPVCEDRQNDLYFFRVNIRFVIIVIWLPSARESRRDFHIFVTKRFSYG